MKRLAVVYKTSGDSALLLCSSAACAEEQKSNSSRMLSSMVLDAQFAGPFKDTIVQRWIDVSAGAICYLYIPVSVPALPDKPQAASGGESVRVYGPNGIGSISCIPAVIQQRK
jgi:hypothetical protein